MYKLRPANERGYTQTGWLDSYHTFSFGQYYDPHNMGFSDLRVINDDVVAPEQGFGMHPHDNMEIISVVLKGKLEHKDSLGNGSVVKAGEIQTMTAGSGITHSEFNPSKKEPVHFLQIWILTNKEGLAPAYAQKAFDAKEMNNMLQLVVSEKGEDGSLKINQDVKLYQAHLEAKKAVAYEIPEGRAVWVQVAEGSVEVNDNIMVAGDGLAVFQEKILEIRGVDKKSNILVFDLRGHD